MDWNSPVTLATLEEKLQELPEFERKVAIAILTYRSKKDRWFWVDVIDIWVFVGGGSIVTPQERLEARRKIYYAIENLSKVRIETVVAIYGQVYTSPLFGIGEREIPNLPEYREIPVRVNLFTTLNPAVTSALRKKHLGRK